MKKYNYTVSIEAPSQEIADMLIEHICKENYDLLEMMNQGEEEKEETEQQPPQDGKNDMVKKLESIQKVIQIVAHCIQDESALDRIASLFGINNSKTANETI